ncbi:hypothetical protein [Calothrix sp. NIES-2098]|uniref:hypothetical protein n=1 Tax=Calothrix sp. NIES-2098 TaxID=1954171 RepID=UPI000B5E0C8D|nr:hypothetical protein NIES2098_65920 [Calothrix sp. NIES-2098]
MTKLYIEPEQQNPRPVCIFTESDRQIIATFILKLAIAYWRDATHRDELKMLRL